MRLPSMSAALVAALAWTVRGADDHRSDLKSITVGAKSNFSKITMKSKS